MITQTIFLAENESCKQYRVNVIKAQIILKQSHYRPGLALRVPEG